MNPTDKIFELSQKLASSAEPFPILLELLMMLDTEDSSKIEFICSLILDYFESIRKSSSLETLGRLIQTLRNECSPHSASAEFLNNSYKALEILGEEAHVSPLQRTYKSLIRTFSASYLWDGTIPSCPECRSTNVGEGENSMYEFTDMRCRDCGHSQFADEYQLEEWYQV